MTKKHPESAYPRTFMRSIAAGGDGVIVVEVTLLRLEPGIGVVLREVRTGPAMPQDFRLASSFEWVSTTLRWELTCLQGLSPDLRFFHRTYEMRPTGTLHWQVRESVPEARGTRWTRPNAEVLQSLEAGLA